MWTQAVGWRRKEWQERLFRAQGGYGNGKLPATSTQPSKLPWTLNMNTSTVTSWDISPIITMELMYLQRRRMTVALPKMREDPNSTYMEAKPISPIQQSCQRLQGRLSNVNVRADAVITMFRHNLQLLKKGPRGFCNFLGFGVRKQLQREAYVFYFISVL